MEQNIDAELAVAHKIVSDGAPLSFDAFDPTDPLTSDRTDLLRFEVGLTGLRHAVVGMESFGDDLGSV
jgi:hypothetical protein